MDWRKELKELNNKAENEREKDFIKHMKKISGKTSRKTGNIMKARSDIKKNGNKYTVDTEVNIKKGIDDKIKRALKKSVNEEFDKKIKGSGVRKIVLDYSSDEDSIRGKGNFFSNNVVEPEYSEIVPDVEVKKKPSKRVLDRYNKRTMKRVDIELENPELSEQQIDRYVKRREQNKAMLEAEEMARMANKATRKILKKKKV